MCRAIICRENSSSLLMHLSMSCTKITRSSNVTTVYDVTCVRKNSRPNSDGSLPVSIEYRIYRRSIVTPPAPSHPPPPTPRPPPSPPRRRSSPPPLPPRRVCGNVVGERMGPPPYPL